MPDTMAGNPPKVIPAPQEIRLQQGQKCLQLRWSDGSISHIKASRLRAACGCAGCRRQEQLGSPLRLDPALAIAAVEAYGASGLRLTFSDGHDRGLYPWRYLLDLGRDTPRPDIPTAGL